MELQEITEDGAESGGLREVSRHYLSQLKERAKDASYRDVAGMTRRELLAGIGAATLYGSLRADAPPHIDAFDTNLYFLQNTDTEDAVAYIANTVDIMNGATETDWAYRPGRTFHILDEVTTGVERMFLTALGGDAPMDAIDRMAKFQSACPDEYLVSSPYDDVKATFTDDGRLSTFNTGESHQVIYQPAPAGSPTEGPLPGEGGAAGLVIDDEVEWLWDDPFEQREHVGTPSSATFMYEHHEQDIRVRQEAFMPFDAEAGTESGTVTLEYTVENGTDAPVDLGFVYALRANANRNLQDPIFFRTSGNVGEGGDALVWQDIEDGQELSLRLEGADDAGFIRHPISDCDRRRVHERATEYVNDRVIIDDIPPLHRRLRNHIKDAIGEEQYEFDPGTPFDQLLEDGSDSLLGRYLTGYQRTDMTVASGETASFTVTLSAGSDHDTGTLAETRAAWERWLDDALDLDNIHPDFREDARGWAAVLAKNWMPGHGTGHAAPHYQPSYSRVWTRDVSAAAEAFLALGRTDEAWDFFTEYLPAVQEPDGGLHQAYTADGDPAYLVEETADQVADWLIGLDHLDEAVDPDPFAAAGHDTVQDAVDFLTDSIVANGLPEAGWDYAESPHEYRISLYTADKMQRALEAAESHLKTDLRSTITAIRDGKELHFLSDDPFTAAISLGSRDTDYSGMEGVIYLTGHEDDPRYLEDIFSDIGVEDVHNWTVGTNVAARAAAELGDTELTIDGETYTGTELAYKRLKANAEHAQDHGVLYEKMHKDGTPYGARHLMWSHAEAVQAAAAIDNDYTPG